MSTQGVTVNLVLNSASYSAAIKDAQRQIDTFAGKARGAGHSTVSSMQASSAAIRTLEGGMANNVRAVERFITMIPGVGKALQTAFPLIGGLAFAGLLVRLGTELNEFIRKANQVPQALLNGFRELSTSSLLANDELRKTNDTLQAQIDKLSGRHENTLALTLDEARINADKLAQSLDRDNQQIQQLLKSNQVSILGGIFTNQIPTAAVSGQVNYWNQELANLGHAYNQAVHNAGGDTNSPAVQQAQAALTQRRQDAIRSFQSDLTLRRVGAGAGEEYAGNQQANINIDAGELDLLNNQQDQANLQTDNVKLTAREKSIQASKEFADQQKALQEQIVQQWHQQLDDLKSAEGLTLSQEADFWISRAAMAQRGSKSYTSALDEANKDIAQVRAENRRGEDAFAKTSAEPLDTNDLSVTDRSSIQSSSKTATDYLKNLNEGIELQRQNAQAIAEASLQMEVATGRISAFDAANIQAALHTQEYEQSLSQLQDALGNVANDPGLSQLDKNAQSAALNNQIAALNGQRSTQVLQDQQATSANTVTGSMSMAINQMVQAWTNASQQITGFFSNSVGTLNDTLVNVLTTRDRGGNTARRQFEAAGHSVFTDLTRRGLQATEGSLFSSLGFGSQKADGSSANPFYVRIASGAGGAISGAAGEIGGFVRGIFGGGTAPSMTSQALSTTSSAVSSVLDSIPLQGFFAAGGDVVANRPAMIGEAGPEVFWPHSAGTIIPNNQLGGSTNHNISIDARGSTDPAATEAAVHRAMSRYLPSSVAASVAAVQDRNRRVPLSTR
ncbi:hypothetical protein HNQ77_002669 [Silvibacterium bohemicum]|uniref:Bacteriophage tail tape measure N-terminal domain-containing protein n=1 Tax=Silvibacterium bohemicum TaxID=1577686 RepID=A0A841JTI2_9BACT|nr:hypothetical protein [Silvibacterium bohemicum]MBB6144713.1 hypothetical protein [Silvibacterium bohemicum]